MHGCLASILLLCGTFFFANPAFSSAVEPPSTADCSSFINFLENEEMLLSYTAALGESCVTIETTLFFDDAGLATEMDANGNALGDFGYQVIESSGQCVLASTESGCGAQVLSFNSDNSALTLTSGGEDASLTPVEENSLTTDIYNETADSYHLTIADAINSASTNDVIVLSAASFSPSGQVTIDKALTLKGAGSSSTTINGGGSSYAIAVYADGVHLEGFTLNGAATYGIKVSNSPTSILSDFSMTDVATDGTANTGIDLNGVDGATLTNIAASNTAGGFGLALASSSDVTIDGLSTSGNAWGDAAIFPAGTAYQIAGYEAPTNITFEGTLDLSSGAGSISVQDGNLASGGTWAGTISIDAADNADVTVPTNFDARVDAVRNDGLSFQVVAPGGAAEIILAGLLGATSPFTYSAITLQNLLTGEWAVSAGMDLQAAIDAAESGDTIELDGAISTDETVNVNKPLTMYGAGSGTTTINTTSSGYGISISADDVSLSGFTLDGSGTFGVKASGIANFSLNDVEATNGGNSAIDLNGVDGATLTNIAASNTALGYGLAIASSADVTVDGITTSSNTYGAIGIFPAQTQYQDAALEAPSNIVIEGAVSLTGGAGAITVQNGALNSGGTWVGTVSNDPADNADVTVPAAFTHALYSTRNDGVTGQSVAAQAVIQGLVAYAAANPVTGIEYTDVYIYDMDNGDYEVIEPLLIQDAIDAASAGDEINVSDGAYEIATTIDVNNVNKSLTIEGESMAGTILDASAMTPLTNRVVETNADNITLRNLTIKPITDPDAGANNSIGFTIKAGANNGATINDGLVMENITIDGAAERTPFDFHGLDNVTLTNLNASGTTRGNGMQFTGCTNVTLNSFTGTANAWGSIAIYASRYVPAEGRGSDNITIEGSGLSIDGTVFSQDDLDPSNGDLLNTNITVNGWDFLVYNDEFRGGYNDSEEYTFFAEDETAAVTLALGLNTANTASSAQEISTSDWIVGDGMAIAPALADATAGQNVEVRAGTYEEDLSFDKQLNINGPNAGIAHDGGRSAEAIIDGEHTLSATGAVMIDGLQFLSNNSAQTSTIYISTAAGHTIQNNQFVSSIAGGNTGGQHDLALYTATLASGSLTITENSFSGDGSFSDGDRYSTAAWGRGIWLNGGGAAVTVSNNAFTNCRTGMNLENYANSASSIASNSFIDCGTGMALGVPTAGEITSITGNSFQDVDTDINARNLTADITWDLAATANGAVPGNSTYYSDLGFIPGNSAGDIDDPNGNLAYLSGSGADRLIFGGEDITATGDYGGAADDYMDGGAGTNRANYGDNLAELTLTAYGDTLFVASPTAGNDTLVNFGSLVLADQTFAVVFGCTDASADNYDASANVENLSCEFLGCTNIGACNFDSGANTDDGSCEFTSCAGCRDEGACNYDPAATLDGPAGSCTYPATYYVDCDGNCLDGFDLDNNGTCDPEDVPGCMNGTASNYNAFATVPDGSCQFEVVGCIQSDACNFNPDATIADVTSTCIFPSEPYLNCQGACLNDSDGDGTCDEQEVPGCEDPSAANYNPAATDDDGSCIIESAPGCLIPSATNYDPTVTVQGQPITSFCTFNFQNPPMISPPAVDCADTYACNYDNTASGYTECEYSSCLGCTVTSACNYDATAVYNDGSCEYTSCAGCTASGACNYDATASINDGSCEYTSCAGCTEPNANNYDATATIDDASCEYLGCTNTSACNYGCADPAACAAAGESGPNTDDGSCEFTSCAGCMTSGACNYDATATISAACEYTTCAGCMDNTADNYDATATIDNGTCEYEGCTNGSACNYDATANVDDGSCTYAASGFDCDGNCLDLNNNNICDSAETPVPGCTNPAACNYDNTATQNDGSCTVVSASANDITVQLDANGVASIVPGDFDNESGGGCTVASSTVSPNAFDVDDLGPNNAVLTVTDDQGNSDTDGFVVTVEDNIPPVASANDITIAMTSTSQEVILEALDVSTSTDNAGIESQTLSQNSFFGCDDVKTHVVTLTVVDFAGNSDYVTFNVTITHPDVDNDGICDDQDNCTDLTANNYNDPANGVCQPCGTAPVFLGILASSPAVNMTEANGVVTLDITSGAPITLQLTGLNGTPDVTATIPAEMGTIPAGFYEARIIDADGCLGVASAPGGSTFGQPSVYYPLIMPYTQCCTGCGVYDADTDGICDDSDNCIDKLATNYGDPTNEDCVIPGCTDAAYTEYNASATTDDGSCSTLIVEGCMDPTYTEYDASANTDDGSCATLASTCDSPSMDGYDYAVVEIGDQCWFAENLRTTVYADGSAIPEETDNTAWVGLSTGARCDYDNDASNVATYGRLYNWYAATDAAELCPTGWHVPTDDEWTALETYLGANGHSGTEGAALKSTSGWALRQRHGRLWVFGPSGRLPLRHRWRLHDAGYFGLWWSSSPSGGSAWFRCLYSLSPDINRSSGSPRYGFSVRCLRDAD